MKYFNCITALFLLFTLAACQKDDTATPDENDLILPESYVFYDASGNNTVSFVEQAQRLEMLNEMTDYLKSANTPGVALDASLIKDMYSNNNVPWADLPGLGMAASNTQLKNKTAAASGEADPEVQEAFETLMESIADLSATTVSGEFTGGPGQGGVVQSETSPGKHYLQNEQGLEYTQFIEKGLMGAVFYNQIVSVFLGEEKMSADNEAAVDPDSGLFYTAMEHNWDQAFGYFTTALDFPESGTDRFWAKYAAGREPLMGSASILSRAFLLGRVAISSKNYAVRDEQIAIIRGELERVSAATAMHYLNSANANLSDDALRNHALSEAVVFLENLKCGYNPQIATSEITDMRAIIGEDFYAVSPGDLITVRNLLAERYNLEDVKDAL